MKLEPTNWNIDELTEEPLDNVLILVSNGKVKKAQLPDYSTIKITTENKKVKLVTCEQKHLF